MIGWKTLLSDLQEQVRFLEADLAEHRGEHGRGRPFR
jgi:hypothetical protein